MAGENWLIGIWLSMSGLSGNPNQTQLDAAAGQVFATGLTNLWNPSTGVKLATYNTSASDLSKASINVYRGGSFAGTGLGVFTPTTGLTSSGLTSGLAALCVSTHTAQAGRSGRGRMYLPMSAKTTQINLQYANADLTGILATVKSWLGVLGTGVGASLPGTPTCTPVVVSLKHSTFSAITSLSADSLPDTQHGRNRRVPPAFKAQTSFP